MSLVEALKLRKKIRTLRSRHTTFVIIPVGWVWIQLIAGLVFVGGAAWAGFAAGGVELEARAKTAVGEYFKNLQGGMTEAELQAKLQKIRDVSLQLDDAQPLGRLVALEAADKSMDAALKTLDRRITLIPQSAGNFLARDRQRMLERRIDTKDTDKVLVEIADALVKEEWK